MPTPKFLRTEHAACLCHSSAALRARGIALHPTMFERYIEPVYSLAALLFVSSPELLQNLTSVNWQEPTFQHAILMIFALPLSWNVLARTEYHYKLLRKLACGSKRLACYMLALYIFVVGQYRSAVAEIALRNQPHMSLLPSRLCSLLTGCSSDTADFYLGWTIILLGQALVLPSMWKLGIVGTYLGDYCGIYLPARVRCVSWAGGFTCTEICVHTFSRNLSKYSASFFPAAATHSIFSTIRCTSARQSPLSAAQS